MSPLPCRPAGGREAQGAANANHTDQGATQHPNNNTIPPRVGGIPLTTGEDLCSSRVAIFGPPDISATDVVNRSLEVLKEWR